MKKKLILIVWLCCISLCWVGFAQDVGFSLTPEAETNTGEQVNIITGISATWGNVINKYNEEADRLENDLWTQLATGVMNRNTLLNYMVYVIKFLSQLGIFIGAAMIIYAGYLYATQVFGWEVNKANTAIKHAIIWVIVITFAYAILKIFTAMFLGT